MNVIKGPWGGTPEISNSGDSGSVALEKTYMPKGQIKGQEELFTIDLQRKVAEVIAPEGFDWDEMFVASKAEQSTHAEEEVSDAEIAIILTNLLVDMILQEKGDSGEQLREKILAIDPLFIVTGNFLDEALNHQVNAIMETTESYENEYGVDRTEIWQKRRSQHGLGQFTDAQLAEIAKQFNVMHFNQQPEYYTAFCAEIFGRATGLLSRVES